MVILLCVGLFSCSTKLAHVVVYMASQFHATAVIVHSDQKHIKEEKSWLTYGPGLPTAQGTRTVGWAFFHQLVKQSPTDIAQANLIQVIPQLKFAIKVTPSCIKLTIKEEIRHQGYLKKIIRNQYYFVKITLYMHGFGLVSGKTGSHVAQANLKIIINLRMTSNS